MNHQDLKTVVYYASSAYSTHGKRNMSVDQYFKVRDYTKVNKNAVKFVERVRQQAKH